MPYESQQVVSEFDAAKQIAELLAELDRSAQERVLRWVGESLGIAATAAPSGAANPPAQPPSGARPADNVQAGAPPGTPSHPPNRPQDIRTFVQEKQPKSDNQYAAVVAYYYQFEAPQEQRTSVINAETLQEAARLAGRARLGNPGATLNNATAQGYLDRVDAGQFKISTVGENLVALTLPGHNENGSGGKHFRKRTQKKQPNKAAKRTAKRTAKKTGKKTAEKTGKKTAEKTGKKTAKKTRKTAR